MYKWLLGKKRTWLLAGILGFALCAPLQADTPKLPTTIDTTISPRQLQLSAREMERLTKTEENMIDQRTRAEAMLKANPKDYKGHLLLGFVLHRAEGDLPRARYHLEKAKDLSIKKARHGDREAGEFLDITIYELLMVLTEMDKYQEKIDLLKKITSSGDFPLYLSEMAWPLMKLDREKEAREVIDKTLHSDSLGARANAWNTLGALEAELGHYQASYDAFMGLNNELERYHVPPNITFWRNIGEVCLPLGNYDEAEKCYRLSASLPFDQTCFSNPYQDLTRLYLGQARFSEAIEAIKKTLEWSGATKPFLYQQSMAENAELQGMVLLECGLPYEAVNVLQLLVQRPDRRGGTSVDIDQSEAGNLLVWSVALQTELERNRERLAATSSWTGLWELAQYGWNKLRKQKNAVKSDSLYVNLVLENWDLRLKINRANKRIAALSANKTRIRASMLPYNSQSIMTTEWYRPALMGLWGTGLSEVALKEISDNPPENFSFVEPFLTALHGEIAYLRGNNRDSLALFGKALQTLPRQEAMLRLRTQTRAAMLCQKMGDQQKAMAFYQAIWQEDPAWLRELGARVPVNLEISSDLYSESPLTFAAVERGFKRSPRFKSGAGGFRLLVSSHGNGLAKASVLDSSGNALKSCDIKYDPKGGLRAAADFLCELHDGLLAPNINLSNLMDGSLDGTNVTTNLKQLLR